MFESHIKSADLIVLYGVSLGKTDRKWWELIGKQIVSHSCMLIYFVFDPNKDTVAKPNYKKRWLEDYMKELIQKCNVAEPDVESLKQHVCIGLNKDVFKG